jgi:hypothetical protein
VQILSKPPAPFSAALSRAIGEMDVLAGAAMLEGMAICDAAGGVTADGDEQSNVGSTDVEMVAVDVSSVEKENKGQLPACTSRRPAATLVRYQADI